MPGSIADLLRLLAVPVFVWAALHDIRTRRVPNWIWQPLAVLAVILLGWEAWAAYAIGGFEWQLFSIRAAISLGIVAPLGYLFWRLGGFGGADAKALIVLAVLFPTYPSYTIGSLTLPYEVAVLGVFSLTILTNAVIVGMAYPLALSVANAAAGRFRLAMFVGLPVHWRSVETTHGRLLESANGFSGRGLDLDALRMYLRWRGCSLEDLRAEPAIHRDPASLPAEPYPAGDGAVTDGGHPSDQVSPDPVESGDSDVGDSDASSAGAVDADTVSAPAARHAASDAWGAVAFLDDVGSAYGTRPETLRTGLELLSSREHVWVSPGIPFIVPMAIGLLLALTYGDLLFVLMRALGIA